MAIQDVLMAIEGYGTIHQHLLIGVTFKTTRVIEDVLLNICTLLLRWNGFGFKTRSFVDMAKYL